MSDVERQPRVGLKARVLRFVLKLFRVQPAVRFSDVQLLIAGVTPPPFDTQEGDYQDYDVCIAGDGSVSSGSIPESLGCPADFVIYASNADWLLTCHGYGADHAIVTKARQNADAVAAGLLCTGGCVTSVEETWRGWDCRWSWDTGMFLGSGAVELRVSCTEL